MSSTPEDEGERGRLADAKEFLRDLLRAGPKFTGRIKAEAKEAEIGWRTVERAKAELKVQAVKHPDSGKWQWTLSGPTEEGDEEGASSPRQSEHGGDGGDGGLRGLADIPSTGTRRHMRRPFEAADDRPDSPVSGSRRIHGDHRGRRAAHPGSAAARRAAARQYQGEPR